MRMLALDVGDKRIGVAICDPLGILASPLTVIERKKDGADFEAISALINEYCAERLIVGLPRLPNGTLGTQTEKTQTFVDSLAHHINIPIEMYDERFSTDLAEQLLRDAGKNPQQIKKMKDAAAAALILQWYLDQKAARRNEVMENEVL